MPSLLLKTLTIALLVIGEFFAIYAEVNSAKQYVPTGSFLTGFWKMALIAAIAGAFLVAGYMLGYTVFKDIWVVSVLSIASILVAEPVITYFIFQELPARGPLVGLLLGMLGLVATFVL